MFKDFCLSQGVIVWNQSSAKRCETHSLFSNKQLTHRYKILFTISDSTATGSVSVQQGLVRGTLKC